MIKPMFSVNDDDFKSSGWCGNRPRCVKVAVKPGKGVAVRDSKDPSKTTMFFNPTEWRVFIKGAKAGEFDI
jgi:hypothetical protein